MASLGGEKQQLLEQVRGLKQELAVREAASKSLRDKSERLERLQADLSSMEQRYEAELQRLKRELLAYQASEAQLLSQNKQQQLQLDLNNLSVGPEVDLRHQQTFSSNKLSASYLPENPAYETFRSQKPADPYAHHTKKILTARDKVRQASINLPISQAPTSAAELLHSQEYKQSPNSKYK